MRRTHLIRELSILACAAALSFAWGWFSEYPAPPVAGPAEAAKGPPSQPQRLSVLSYNIDFRNPEVDGVVAAIARADADIVCLQEVTPEDEQAVRRLLAKQYPHVHFHPEEYAGGIAVLSKWPLETVKPLPPKVGWLPALLVHVKLPDGPAQLLNVHLRPPQTGRGVGGVIGKTAVGYFSTRPVRREELKDHMRHLAPGVPALIIGDFNENAGGMATTWLAGEGFTSALAEFAPHAHTWLIGKGRVALRDQLDHIFFSGDFRCVDATVGQQGPSDHLPVTAVLERASGAADAAVE